MDIMSYLLAKDSSGGGGGSTVDLSDYFNSTISYGTSSKGGWKDVAKRIPDEMTINNASCAYMFSGYPASTIPNLTIGENITVTNCSYMFNSCRQVEVFDLSTLDLSSVTDVTSMFYYCQSATKIDIRTLDNTIITNSSNMMGNISSGCLIIVKDDDFKTWLTNKFSSLTNVKTVDEYES